MENLAFFKGFVRMCQDGWLMGWHERNGGNLSYRMTEQEVADASGWFMPEAEWHPLGVTVENMGNACFLVTGSGRFMRNVPESPAENLCILQLDETGTRWKKLWGLIFGGVPTSELAAHMRNHSVKMEATAGKNRVVYHAHPANVIAMTYILPLTDRDFTRALWQSETECPVVFPQGVGVVPCMVPGSWEIAQATAEKMTDYDGVIWAQHGMFAVGPDFDTAFGLMHTVEKAAEIYMKVVSSGQPVLNTISDQMLEQIAEAYHVKLNPAFL